MPRLPQPDTSRCPLCGQSNRCAMAAGLAPESCWCMAQPINRSALQALPDDQRGIACICPACGSPNGLAQPPATGSAPAPI